jgi:hypothetical protein
MFNENFSFVSSSPTSAAFDINEYTTADISPFTSRPSSPRPQHAQPATSHPYRRDSRYDSYRAPRHPSITALTAQLETHALTSDHPRTSPSTTRGSISSGTDMDMDTSDEGFYEGPDTPPSDYDADFDHSLFDLSMRDLHATSSPRPSLSLEAQALSSHSQRRRQRQALVRLQCMAKRAPDLAMLIEECHPSSMPLSSDPLWQTGTKSSRSSISASVSRVEKERWSSVRNIPRMRKRGTR